MNKQLEYVLTRLKKPSTILSIVSQVVAILLMLGFKVDESLIMMVATAGCSLLVTMGILSNPDSVKKGYGDDILTCSGCGLRKKHVMVNGQMVCEGCGAVYDPSKELGENT